MTPVYIFVGALVLVATGLVVAMLFLGKRSDDPDDQ